MHFFVVFYRIKFTALFITLQNRISVEILNIRGEETIISCDIDEREKSSFKRYILISAKRLTSHYYL